MMYGVVFLFSEHVYLFCITLSALFLHTDRFSEFHDSSSKNTFYVIHCVNLTFAISIN